MPVIYTDQNGQGYDYGQLSSAYAAGQFGAGSRVADILAMNGPSPTLRPDVPDNPNIDYTDTSRPSVGTMAGMGSIAPLSRIPENPNASVYTNPGAPTGDLAAAGAMFQQAGQQKVQPVPAYNQGQSTQTPYNNSSQSLLLNAVMQRMNMLQQPADTSMSDLFAKMGLAQVDKLSGAPFTDTQNAALLTQHMQPLTQARDATKQQAAEQLSRRGIGPTSGVFIDTMNKIDQSYQQGVAGVTNTLNQQGIDQTTKNQQMQMQILSSLSNMQNANNQTADQRSMELMQAAGMPFNTDLQTLQALTNAGGSGGDASSLISSLLGIGNLNQSGTSYANQQNGANSQAIGSVIGYILNNHSMFGF